MKDMIGMTSAEWHELRICMSQVLPSFRRSVGWKHAGWNWLMSPNGVGAFFAGGQILAYQGSPKKAHRGNHIVCRLQFSLCTSIIVTFLAPQRSSTSREPWYSLFLHLEDISHRLYARATNLARAPRLQLRPMACAPLNHFHWASKG